MYLPTPPHSPYEGTLSPLSYEETVEASPEEASPVEELRMSYEPIYPPNPEPRFTAAGGTTEVTSWDVRLLPIFFTGTYWCGLAVLYASMLYTVVMSSTWRGPVLIWALLIVTVVFALWRHLPAEKQRMRKLCDEVVLLRCGGYYSLAEPPCIVDAGAVEMEERPMRVPVRQTPLRGTFYAAIE